MLADMIFKVMPESNGVKALQATVCREPLQHGAGPTLSPAAGHTAFFA